MVIAVSVCRLLAATDLLATSVLRLTCVVSHIKGSIIAQVRRENSICPIMENSLHNGLWVITA